MNIKIEQEKLSYKPAYKITVDGRPLLAKDDSSFLKSKTTVFDTKKNALISVIQKLSLFKKVKELTFPDGEVWTFQKITGIAPVYKCDNGQDIITIYGHSKGRCSIYRKEKQIGTLSKNAVSISDGDSFNLSIDDIENPLLHIAIAISIDAATETNNNGNIGINIDFGYIGPEAKEYDPNWKPNLSKKIK